MKCSKRIRSFLLAMLSIILMCTQSIYAAKQNISLSASPTIVSGIERTYPIYNVYDTGMNNPEKKEDGSSENVMKMRIDGKDAFCVQPDIQFYNMARYTHKLSGNDALAMLRTNYIGLRYSDDEILKMQRIASAGYGYNKDYSDDLFAATQIMIWKIKHANEIAHIRWDVQPRIKEIMDRLKVWDLPVAWNNHAIALKGYGKENAQTIEDHNGVFQYYILSQNSPGIHAEQNGNALTIWADKTLSAFGTIRFQALYQKGEVNNQVIVYASDRNQTLGIFGKISTPEAGLTVSVHKMPTFAEVRSKKESDAALQAKIRLIKKDEQTHAPIEGITFQFYRDHIDESGWIGEGISDKKGEIQLKNEEVKHFSSKEYIQQYCTNIDQVDEETKKTVLTKEQAQREVEQKAENDLKVNIRQFQSENHRYFVKETKTKKTYFLDVKNDTFSKTMTGSGTIQFEIVNKPIQGRIEITKEGSSLTGVSKKADGTIASFVYEQIGLQGAEFDIVAKEDIQSPNNGSILYKKGEVVDHIKTNEKGKAASQLLYLGSYRLIETKTPKGYHSQEHDQDVELTAKENNQQIIDTFKTIKNTRKKMKYTIRKETEDHKPIKGVVFGLYANEDIANYEGTRLISKGSLITKVESDEKGHVDFGLDLPQYEYTIKELSAPTSFVKTAEDIKIHPYQENKHAVINRYRKGKIQIIKTGESLQGVKKKEDGTVEKFIYNNKGLTNAEFDIIANEDICNPVDQSILIKKGAMVDHIKTNERGMALTKDLYFGSYRIIETNSPMGYIKTDKTYVVKVEDTKKEGDLVSRTIYNQRRQIKCEIHKKSLDEKKSLQGAVFGLYAKEDIRNWTGNLLIHKGELIARSTSNAEGMVLFSLDLPMNIYEIKEIQAPDGYILNKEIITMDSIQNQSHFANFVFKQDFYNNPLPKNTSKPIRNVMTSYLNGWNSYLITFGLCGLVLIWLFIKNKRR